MKKTIQYRCQMCNDENCNHTFELKVFEEDGKFFMGQGPYSSREEAEQVIENTIKVLEERNNQNRA